MTSSSSSADRQRRIGEIAHRIWESEGRPSGQAIRHWHMAEKLVSAEERARRNKPSPNDSPLGNKVDP